MRKIFDIIYDYQNSKKDVDLNFINEIIMSFCNCYDLNDYITNTEIFYNKTLPQAQYNVTTKEIYINPVSINKVLLQLDDEFECLKHNKLFSYLYIAKVLLHEIEHAYQQKKINNVVDIEGEILRAEYKPALDAMNQNILFKIPKMIKINRLKDKYYNFSPSERLAENIACEQTKTLALLMDDEECYDIFEHFKYGNILRGYNVGLVNYLSGEPTKTYIEKVNPHYDYSIIKNLSFNMTQYDKMKFGLEVEKDTLNKTAKEWEKIYTKIKNNG